MEIRHIISFEKVASLKSFSKASKALFLSQPSITRHINELENSLDAKLLIRGKSSIELTEVGRVFLEYANQLISINAEAIDSIANVKKGKKIAIRLAFSGQDCHWILPQLDKFKRYYSDVEINMSILWSKDIISKLLSRDIHFGIIRTDSPVFMHPLLNAVKIEEDEAILVFSPEHRFAKIKEVTVTDISKEPFLVFGKGTTFWSNQILAMYGSVGAEPKICVESTDYHVIKLLVQANWGISFLARPCVQKEINKGLLKTLPVKGYPPLKRYSILLWRKDISLNKSFKSFIDLMGRYSGCIHS